MSGGSPAIRLRVIRSCMTFREPASTSNNVHVANDVATREVLDPVFQGIQGVVDVSCSHQSPDGCAADDVRLNTGAQQLAQQTDVRPSTGGATA